MVNKGKTKWAGLVFRGEILIDIPLQTRFMLTNDNMFYLLSVDGMSKFSVSFILYSVQHLNRESSSIIDLQVSLHWLASFAIQMYVKTFLSVLPTPRFQVGLKENSTICLRLTLISHHSVF